MANKGVIKAVVFDFDGVIALTEEPTFRLLQSIVGELGYELSDSTLSSRVGKKITKFIDEVYGNTMPVEIKQQALNAFYKEYSANSHRYMTAIPATTEFIKSHSRDLKIGIASVGNKSTIENALQRLELLAHVDVIVSSDDVTNLKPHPEIYKKAAVSLGVLPKEIIAVEDSVVGAESAIGAGCQTFVLLNGTNNKSDFDAHAIRGFLVTQQDIVQLTE